MESTTPVGYKQALPLVAMLVLALAAPVYAEITEWHVEGKVYHSQAENDAAVKRMEEAAKQKVLQKAAEGGYVVNYNGVEYGTPEVLKRHRENKRFRYYDPRTGGTHQFGGANGKPVSKEQFMRESAAEVRKQNDAMAAHFRDSMERGGENIVEGLSADGKLPLEQAHDAMVIDMEHMELMDEAERIQQVDESHPTPWKKKVRVIPMSVLRGRVVTHDDQTPSGMRGSPITDRPFGSSN